MTSDMKDGVYFDLAHDDYLKLPRLGSSSLTDLRTSPATFWQKSWMNPDKRDDDTPARAIGRAYHMARLEPNAFARAYARGFDPADHPDALRTDADVKAALADLGEPMTKKGELALDRALRLRGEGYQGEVVSLLVAQHMEDHAGKALLSPEVFDQIIASAVALRRTPEIGEMITGGASEVSILWTRECGTRMRARIDHLRPDGWADLKTFSNPHGKPVDQCLVDAFRFNRYYVQAALYHEAVEAVRAGAVPFGDDVAGAGAALLREVVGHDGPLPINYVFIESNGSPNILARRVRAHAPVRGAEEQAEGAAQVAPYMVQPSRLMMKGQQEVDYAVRVFRRSMEIHGEGEPWGPLIPVGHIEDGDYHDDFLDGDGR